MLIRNRIRDIWRWLDDLGRDVRHAVRGLRRNPGFTATVVVVLAVGIGVTTATFGIVYGVLLRPLPYPDPDAIVHVGEVREGQSGSSLFLTNTMLPRIREEASSFEHLAAYEERSLDWLSPAGAMTLNGATVSPSLFPLLRAVPHLGRHFTEEEALSEAVGVLAEGFFFPSREAEFWTPFVIPLFAQPGPGDQAQSGRARPEARPPGRTTVTS